MFRNIRSNMIFALLFTLLLMSFPKFAVAEEKTWHAGAARIKITPERFMWMSGYGARNHPAEGKLTDLWAKALVLDDSQGQRAVLITMDLLGLDRGLSQSICKDLADHFQLERKQIALATSHTHTGPVVAQNLRPMHYLQLDQMQRKLVDEYASSLRKKTVELVARALQTMKPVKLSWGSGICSVAVNRRNNREVDVPQLRAEGKLIGPVDHDVPVLAVHDLHKNLISVVFGYACHATVLSFYQWSGDYPGFAQIELEKKHPDTIAMFWAGCGADQNPLPRRKVEYAREYGKRLADAVDTVLSGKMTNIDANLSTQYQEVDLPLDTLPTIEQLKQQSSAKDKFVAVRGKMLLEEVQNGKPLAQTYPYPIAQWKLGSQVQWIFLGGEVVVDYALRLKTELREKNTWVTGYINDVMAYIPSRRVLFEGGYEGESAMVYYGLPTKWAPEVEQIIIKEVHRQSK